MNYQEKRYVRFQDWTSDKSSSFEKYDVRNVKGYFAQLLRNIALFFASFRTVFVWSYERIGSLTKSFGFRSRGDSSSRNFCQRKVLDPQGPFLQRWNKIFVLLCVVAISVDPLFLYIPFVDSGKKCLDLDHKLGISACVLRSFTDLLYIIHIFLEFRTGFIAPSSRVFGRGELVDDLSAIAKRYLSSYFLIDILAVLPLPQIVILVIMPELRGSASFNTKNMLWIAVVLQYIPRLIRICPLYKNVTRTSGIFAETAWAGAGFNLFLYMLASHVIGAFWYLLAIEREDFCWRRACRRAGCDIRTLYCGEANDVSDKSFLEISCPIIEEDAPFNYGIFLRALQSKVVNSRNFVKKLFFCFWWGLQNLSSLGQDLETSTYEWEIAFAIFISIYGLVLFSLLIGNMQTYLQSTTVRLEEMRLKRRDAEQWMSHRLLPETIRERVRQHEQYNWQETRGVDEEIVLKNLPKDLRREIKRHLCLSLVLQVPLFEKMDEQLLDAICDRLKPALYTQNSYIVREGEPVDEMLFVMRGKLESVTTNGGRTGFFNSDTLKSGDFCGEELLTWALDPQSTNLPASTRTVRTITEVEAFAFLADDLKFIASQFRRLHSKQLRHTFRFYSHQWKTWAACFIQAAWRRYQKKKLEDSLCVEEDKLQIVLSKQTGGSPSLGATIYASRFAANVLRALHRNRSQKMKVPKRLPPMLLQKPAEPDFSDDEKR